MSGLISADTLAALLRGAAVFCGAGSALLLFSLAVWTARDIAARTRERWLRLGAVALVLVLNIFGLIIYLLLRPRETIAERYERELIEEILARELNAAALASRPAARSARPVEG